MDKSGKLFNKINIVDLCVILLIVVFVIGIAIRLTSSSSEKIQRTRTFEYTVEVSKVRYYSVDALKKLGNTTDIKGTTVLGEIVSVESKPYTSEFDTLDGEVGHAIMPEKYICLVTIKTTGSESDEFYLAPDDTELSVGKSVNIITKYINTSGIIKDIKVVE